MPEAARLQDVSLCVAEKDDKHIKQFKEKLQENYLARSNPQDTQSSYSGPDNPVLSEVGTVHFKHMLKFALALRNHILADGCIWELYQPICIPGAVQSSLLLAGNYLATENSRKDS